MLSFFSFEQHTLFWSILPEFSLVTLVLILIMVAVTTEKNNKAYLLALFLDLTMFVFFLVILYLLSLLNSDLYANTLTIFFCYQTLKLNQVLIMIKALLSALALGSLYNVKRYLTLSQLLGYEYPLLITLATVGMFLTISANNWIILFLSLELQALCFLVLFAWNRRSEKAVNATLKFTVVNFVASTLILLAIIEIILYTQTFNMYLANPVFFFKTLVGSFFVAETSLLDPTFVFWALKQTFTTFQATYGVDFGNLFLNLPSTMSSGQQLQVLAMILDRPGVLLINIAHSVGLGGFGYQALWQFTGFLLVLGFSMKLGLVPFGLWLQDLYSSVSLPALTFFATAPKLTYVTVLLSLYINVFSFINPESFLLSFFVLGGTTIILGNCLMFAVRNHLLTLLAWSSIANMGLLFLLFSQCPFDAYVLVFIIYYTFSTFLFFLVLQYFLIMDQNGTTRHVLYFTDLSVVRYHPSYQLIYLVLIFSFLNFFGIPPLLGFWMKFAALQGIVTNTYSNMDWLLIIILVLMTLVGGFSYLRVLYTLVTENNNLKLQLLYTPNTKHDLNLIAMAFVIFQLIAFYVYVDTQEFFSATNLLTLNILIV
jgi:NADH:ubiquinone oxidoreductase subunit 2 (subunit N)